MSKKKTAHKASASGAIKPLTFYEELARYGMLEDYLKERHSEKYASDTEFRNEMQSIMYRHSPAAVHDIEVIYLEKLCESLSFFLEYIKQCRIPKY